MTTMEQAFAARYGKQQSISQPERLKFTERSTAADVFTGLTYLGLFVGIVAGLLTASVGIFFAGMTDAIVCGFAAAVINRLDAVLTDLRGKRNGAHPTSST